MEKQNPPGPPMCYPGGAARLAPGGNASAETVLYAVGGIVDIQALVVEGPREYVEVGGHRHSR